LQRPKRTGGRELTEVHQRGRTLRSNVKGVTSAEGVSEILGNVGVKKEKVLKKDGKKRQYVSRHREPPGERHLKRMQWGFGRRA